MRKLALIGITLLVGCKSVTAGEFRPTFEVDYKECERDPIISGNSVTFGSGNNCNAGRVVSTKRYKNITKVQAVIDLGHLSANFVNAAFYMVANPTFPNRQPKGNDYCDAGGNKNEWNCREIDFMETNGNKVFQTSLHLGDRGQDAPQRYEYSFAATANNACFNYKSMMSSPTPTNGLHSLVAGQGINMGGRFNLYAIFTYGGTPSMKTSYYQDGMPSINVYDTTKGPGAEGSQQLDYQDLKKTMNEDGYWLVLSFWQGYSPAGPGSSPWWNSTCKRGNLCNSSGSYWGITEILITADSEE